MWLNNCLNVDKHIFVIQSFVNLGFCNVLGILSEDQAVSLHFTIPPSDFPCLRWAPLSLKLLTAGHPVTALSLWKTVCLRE